jgi:CPA2 family monovalent cation:H+ antiporter-2
LEAHTALPHLRETLLFLALVGILVPLLERLRVNQVLAFLAVGALLGPYGLGELAADYPWLGYVSFAREAGVLALAEVGVLFLLFRIGLELSLARLWALRRWVFGAGTLQVVLSAAAIGAVAVAFGNAVDVALVLGLVLALSSTAVVVQLLVQQRALGTPMGQATFSVLLLQDLAVVPLLVLVTVLGAPGDDTSLGAALGLATVKAAVAVTLIYVLGRAVVRPAFHLLANTRKPEVFTALTLLTALGIGAVTHAAGLSMAMGAFLAGLLLSETEFRHEVEVTVDPFKGLLLGLFFMTVGMGIDFGALLRDPLLIPASVVGLVLIKAAVVSGLFRAYGLSWGRAVEGGLLLGPAGEFAFIVLGSAMLLGLIERPIGEFMLLVVGLSMALTPLLARIGRAVAAILDRHATSLDATPSGSVALDQPHVIIAGCGRVGRLLGELLEAERVPHVAIDADAARVASLRRAGVPVHYGDASRADLLNAVHADRAVALVLTMDEPAAAMHAVRGIRAQYPDLPVFARARDEAHAAALRAAGATLVVPETLESSLQLAGVVLQQIGVPELAAVQRIEQERERRIGALR